MRNFIKNRYISKLKNRRCSENIVNNYAHLADLLIAKANSFAFKVQSINHRAASRPVSHL